jgi:hypothetical protein
MEDIEPVKNKLGEARRHLADMRSQEQRAFGSRFDDCLNAFLSAGRTVDYRLRREYKATYPAWRTKWSAQHQLEDRLLEFIHKDRDVEIHESGSRRIVRVEPIRIGIGGSYSDASGTLEVWGSPTLLLGDSAGATINKARYVFNVDGTERSVTEVCAEYLTTLEGMVADFEADLATRP